MAEIISNNYILFSLLGLLGVYLLLYLSGLTGNKEILRVAWLWYVGLVILLLTTPFILSALSSFDEEKTNGKTSEMEVVETNNVTNLKNRKN